MIKKKKIIICVIVLAICVLGGILGARLYNKNKLVKFETNLDASYMGYVRGLGEVVKNNGSYASFLTSNTLLIKGIDIAKEGEKYVPKELENNYRDYIDALESYKTTSKDNGEINGYYTLMENKLKQLDKKYNISQNDRSDNSIKRFDG